MIEFPRIVFMGTPEFAVPTLSLILQCGYNVVGVVTAPDKPAGRGQKQKESAIKKYAQEQRLPVLQPDSLKDPEFIQELNSLSPDIQIVVAFRMLPEQVWRIPPQGTINLHASLLPQYRGAAPINQAIINGETKTGATTFFINEYIDTGNIILQKEVPIHATDNAGTLHDRLMEAGAKLVVETIEQVIAGTHPNIEQNQVTSYKKLLPAPKLTKEACKINWQQSASTIHNLVRGLSPYPGAWTILQGTEKKWLLKIFETAVIQEQYPQTPGYILTDQKHNIHITTPDGTLAIKSLQLEGKKRMSTEEFLCGFSFEVGSMLVSE